MSGAPGHNRVLALEDFADAALAPYFADVFAHEYRRFGDAFPAGLPYRKYWEVAMAARALDAHRVLGWDAEVLGVGAGNEPTLFWLTRHVRRVFATDLYLGAGEWGEFANPVMLGDPGSQWPGAWDPRRLVTQHMDATDLQHEDGAFDAVFSSSSIEHFGGLEQVRAAAAEACRVLKPGGILSLSTEFRLEGPAPGLPGCLMFDLDDLRAHVVGDLPWDMVSPFEGPADASVAESAVPAEEQMADLTAHFAEHGVYLLHELRFSRYPQVALRLGDHVWTSAHITLRKRDDTTLPSEDTT